MANNTLKITEDKEHYIVTDSVTGKLLWRYSVSGFTLSKVKEYIKKFELDLDKTCAMKKLLTVSLKDKKENLNIYG